MRIPQSVIDELSSRLSLVDVVSGYLSLERKGARFWGLCPFHQEKTPSFSVSPDENVYYCFGCQKGGNLFGFVQEMENLSFPEAVRFLAEREGIEIPDSTEPADNRRSSLIELYNRVTGSFHWLLVNSAQGEAARDYLRRRGVDDESVDAFGLGYAPARNTWLHEFLTGKHYSEEFLVESGLFSRKYPRLAFFQDRLMFPIRNQRGQTLAFGGRALGDREPKYLNSPDTPAFSKRFSLYGLAEAIESIRKQKSFVLAEGYLDVIALHQAGEHRAIAPLGTSFTEEQLGMLRRYAEVAVLLFDGDAAGIRAAEKAVMTCERGGLESEVVLLPEGRDPGDYMREGSLQTLQNVLKSSRKGFIFVLDQAKAQFDVREAGGKESALRHLLPFVDIAQSEVRRQAFLEDIADVLQVDPRAVRSDYTRRAAGERRPPNRKVPEESTPSSQDLFLMLAVSLNRGEFPYVRARVSVEDLADPRAKELYIALEESFRNDETSMDALLARIEDPDLSKLVVEKAARAEFAEHGAEIIKDSVARIKERSLRTRGERVTAEMRALERSGTAAETIRSLQEEKMWIDAELAKLRDSRYE